ncbi:hypothetical protein N9Z45_01255 [Akkermansiaceae bacterium]|nr:hypothetical protein [Akkermansiaceae bacterium]MDB4320127.1 hypothetical protein [Akkermansiaceae bacterium]MDB4363834.1 hypothetical protein [Akkermansiaceae bacterium]MDB4387447.1 hypothetical protein [Akkermansiaceae bacterium]MDB4392975.1 hypothetical protein [Akkermansiaceae bacterium]
MKSIFNILKVLSLIALLVVMTLGYIFFRTWQKNERPGLLDAQWQESEVNLGDRATLEVSLRVPWHRGIDSSRPMSYPDALVPAHQTSALSDLDNTESAREMIAAALKKKGVRKGELDLSGHREWFITVPLVVTEQKVDDGLTVSLSLARTKRISPSSVNIPLPPLTVISPTDLPRDPDNPSAFLVPEPPAPDPEIGVTTKEVKRYWPYLVAGVIALLISLFFILRKAGIIATTPPWEKAMGKLDALDESGDSVVLLSRLTDILKQYTSERFEMRASAKTSTEFLALTRTIEDLPAEQLEELPWLARVADAAKFAGKEPPADAGPRAMSVVRGFVEKTTPQETPDA